MKQFHTRHLQWAISVSLGIATPVASANVYVNGTDVGTSYATSGDLTGTNTSNLINIDGTSGGATSLTIQAGDTIADNDNRTIYVYGGAILGTFSNLGTVIGNTGNPIYVTTSSSITDFNNSGLIQGNLDGAAAVISYGTIGTFLNSGTIEHTGSSSALIYNNATSVRNTGTIRSATGHGVLIGYLNASSGGNFVNDGTIETNGAAGVEAVQIGDGSDADVLTSFMNNGVIRNTGAGAAISVNANATVTNGITNTGLIDGAVLLNTATLNLNGTSGRVTGTITGAAGSTVNVNGKFATENTIDVGTLNIASGGSLALSHQVTATTVTNNGTLALTSGGASTLAGTGPSVTVTGDYNQSSSGSLRIDVTDDYNYGDLTVTGTATLPSNAKIDVNVSNPNYAFSTTTLQNIISAGTLVSDGTFSVTDNSLLFDFSAVKDGNTIDLLLSAAPSTDTRVLGAVQRTGNLVATGAATALDAIFASAPSGELSSLFVPLTTDTQVANAALQTLPLLTGGSSAAMQSTMRGINRDIQLRLDSARDWTEGTGIASERSAWIKPFTSRIDQRAVGSVSGFDAQSQGIVFGADDAASDALRLGAAAAYYSTDIDSRSTIAPHTADLETYTLMGYGSYSLDDRTAIDFQVDASHSNTEGERQIDFAARRASSDYDSVSGHIGAGIGRVYSLASKTRVRPSIRADYTTVKDEAYTETGAGSLSLNVDSRHTDDFIVSAESSFAREINPRTHLTANLGVGYDFINDPTVTRARFTGAPTVSFETYGAKRSPWLGRAGIGVIHRTDKGVEIVGRYNAESRSKSLDQAISLTVRYRF